MNRRAEVETPSRVACSDLAVLVTGSRYQTIPNHIAPTTIVQISLLRSRMSIVLAQMPTTIRAAIWATCDGHNNSQDYECDQQIKKDRRPLLSLALEDSKNSGDNDKPSQKSISRWGGNPVESASLSGERVTNVIGGSVANNQTTKRQPRVCICFRPPEHLVRRSRI